jgi:soluble lytic murein transglycosylase-like protein
MLKTNPLTIRDYLDRLSGLPQRNLPPTVPFGGETVGSGRFKSVLAGLLQSEKGEGANPPGKTIADYRSNPVRTQAYAGVRKPPAAGEEAVRAVLPPPNAIDRAGVADPQAGIAEAPAVSAVGVPSIGGGAGPPGSDGARQIIDRSILQAAEKYDLPPALIRGVVQAESNYRVKAVSPAGAQGLMQLMPATAQELGVEDPFDITQNIDGGARYLRQMLDLFDGDVRHALAAYNAGPGTVKRYNGIPPYPETAHYVNRVIRFSGANV